MSDHQSDLIWGAAAIAREIGASLKQTQHLLSENRIPAKKVSPKRWVASRSKLRAFLGEAA